MDEVVVYGTDAQAALMFEGVAKIVAREPNRTFANDAVRLSARQLRDLISERLGDDIDDIDTFR